MINFLFLRNKFLHNSAIRIDNQKYSRSELCIQSKYNRLYQWYCHISWSDLKGNAATEFQIWWSELKMFKLPWGLNWVHVISLHHISSSDMMHQKLNLMWWHHTIICPITFAIHSRVYAFSSEIILSHQHQLWWHYCVKSVISMLG